MGEALGLLLMLLSAGTRKSSPETALAHDLLLNTIVLFVSPVGGASLSPEEANDAGGLQTFFETKSRNKLLTHEDIIGRDRIEASHRHDDS